VSATSPSRPSGSGVPGMMSIVSAFGKLAPLSLCTRPVDNPPFIPRARGARFLGEGGGADAAGSAWERGTCLRRARRCCGLWTVTCSARPIRAGWDESLPQVLDRLKVANQHSVRPLEEGHELLAQPSSAWALFALGETGEALNRLREGEQVFERQAAG